MILQGKMLPVTVKKVQKVFQTSAMQQTILCTKAFWVYNSQTQLIPSVHLYCWEKKNGIGKEESWDIQWCQLATRTIAGRTKKQVSLCVPFSSLLNHFNGILPIQPQQTRGNKQLNLFFFPVFVTSVSCSNHCKQLTVNQFWITE